MLYINIEAWVRNIRGWRSLKLCFLISLFKNKNIERHTAHTIVSWPNPKQWVIVHSFDLTMIIRQSIYILRTKDFFLFCKIQVLRSLNHYYIWRVSPQLCCRDTGQILSWYTTGNHCFDDGENNEKIAERKILVQWPPPQNYYAITNSWRYKISICYITK